MNFRRIGQQVFPCMPGSRSQTLVELASNGCTRKLYRQSRHADLRGDDNLRQFRFETEMFFEASCARTEQADLGADYTLSRRWPHYGTSIYMGSGSGVWRGSAHGGLRARNILTSFLSGINAGHPGKWILGNILGLDRLRRLAMLAWGRRGGEGGLHARAHRTAPRRSRLRELPQPDGSDRFGDGEL